MDLQSLSLPDWLPWWAVIALLVPVAFYLALFLLMPFSTFGLRARLRDMELRIDALHEDVRALTLRLPEQGGNRFDDAPPRQPPIPPAPRDTGRRDPLPREEPAREPSPRGSLGDPVADRMLAYLRDKTQSDLQRGEPRAPRPRTDPKAEPRFTPPRAPDMPEVEPPAYAPSPIPAPPPAYLPPEADAPPPPRVPSRFGRRHPDGEPGDSRADWPR